MLSLIILGPKSVKMANLDVLEKLVGTLEGGGGGGYNAACREMGLYIEGNSVWTIHDFLGYGIVFECQHQGYRACPPCGSNIVA
jgi:hypothetical protein